MVVPYEACTSARCLLQATRGPMPVHHPCTCTHQALDGALVHVGPPGAPCLCTTRAHAPTRLLMVRWYTLFLRASSSSVCFDRLSWRRRSAFSSPSSCVGAVHSAPVGAAVCASACLDRLSRRRRSTFLSRGSFAHTDMGAAAWRGVLERVQQVGLPARREGPCSSHPAAMCESRCARAWEWRGASSRLLFKAG